MNKIKIFAIIGILSTFFSCSDFLDVVPDNIPTVGHAFTDEIQAYKYLVTCYSYLPRHGQTSENPAFLAGDEAWMPETTLAIGKVEAWLIGRGEQIVTDPILNFWNGGKGATDCYAGIRDCNVFLENIDKVRGIDEMELARWKAEVNVLKAYYHYWLVRMYGPIIINNVNIPVTQIGEELYRSQSGIDNTFAYIIDLIENVQDDLPLLISNRSDELGRITKATAAALKARILVEAASPLFNGNSDFANVTNSEGEKMFNGTYDHSKWEKANVACDSAIAICHRANHRLYQTTDYRSTFKINDDLLLNCALRSAITEPYNNEIIWGCSRSWNSDIQSRSFARLGKYENQVANSNYAPTLKMAELFYSKNGVPITEDTNFDYDSRYSLRKATSNEKDFILEGAETAKLHFDREPRFYSSLGFDRGIWYGSGKYEEGKLQVVKTRFGEDANQFNSTDYSITGYWAKKLVHINTEVNGDKKGLKKKGYPFPIMRMADLYLLKAEAQNEVLDAPNANVYEYINLVRERAGLESVENSWQNHSTNPEKYTTKQGMREIIQQERMIELAFEGQRYWDIRRWKKAINYFNQSILGWDLEAKDAHKFYQPKVLYMKTFSVRDYFWPIKESELTKNTKLVQNIGW